MTNSTNGIVSYAAYLPRYVLTRSAARDAWPYMSMPTAMCSVAGLDEDPISMGAHAALRAMTRGNVTGDQLAAVVFASASSPYVVKSAAAIVADYVGAPPSTYVTDVGGGSHAGLGSLLSALENSSSTTNGQILVVAADALSGDPSDPSDLSFGAGAAAFVVGTGGLATVERASFAYSSYSNTWRAPGQMNVQRYDDERFDRTVGYSAQMSAALNAFLEQLPIEPEWFALHLAGGDLDRLLANSKITADRAPGLEVVRRTGDTGCASALINLGLALDAAASGDGIVAQAYGSGAGTLTAALRVNSAAALPGPSLEEQPAGTLELSYVQFAKHRGHLRTPTVPGSGSAFAASPGWERGKPSSVGLAAQRCGACGSLNFPRRDYCLDCRSTDLRPTPLPRRGTVLTYNLQHIVPVVPEEAPLPVCTVLIDGEPAGRYGGKVAALITDVDPAAVTVGMPVELVPRRGDVDHGLVKYGWKFRPVKGLS